MESAARQTEIPGAGEPCNPFLSWPGGKLRVLDELRSRMPKDVRARRYVEPMVGSGALFFDVRPPNALLCDANHRLICAYTAIRDTPRRVLGALEVHRFEHERFATSHYYQTRERFNAMERVDDAADIAAQLIYLNCACFNGVYRENKKGGFNVPLGDKLKERIHETERFELASRALQGVELRSGHYLDSYVLRDKHANDFVYLDPPYHGGFTAYTAGGFDETEQRRLSHAFFSLDGSGAKVMLSNADTPLIRQLYSGYSIDTIRAPRAVNRDGKGRGSVVELVIRNY